jgi:hypothetical protein
MTSTNETAAVRETKGIPAPLLVVGLIVLSFGFQFGHLLTGLFVASDYEIHKPQGILDELDDIGIIGGAALVIAFAISLSTFRTAATARVGAIVLGVLSILTLPVFFAAAPAIFGSQAAWLGGLAKRSHPQHGVARGFAIVGLVIAILDVLALWGGTLAEVIGEAVGNR